MRVRGIEEFLYRNRSRGATLLVAATVGVVAMIVATILGWRWPSGWFPPISLSDEVETLLAVGTLSLAYAGIIQAASAIQGLERRYRPNLELMCLEESNASKTMLGTRLGVRNLGPGVARQIKLRWFSFPQNPAAKSYYRGLRPPGPATSQGELPFPFLDAQSDSWWYPFIPPPVPPTVFFPMDFVIEVNAVDVFDNRLAIQRYHLVAFHERPQPGGSPSWTWRVLQSGQPGGGAIATIDSLIERASRYPAPFHWDV